MSEVLTDIDACVERIVAAAGPDLVLAAPLGLGKPVQLLNAIYRRVAGDPALSLHIYTALTLEVPQPASEIEAGLAGPIMQRLFGDYEELDYAVAQREGRLPDNIQLTELYFRAGTMKRNARAQQNFIASNYTHIGRDMLAAGVNVMVQMVAVRMTDAGLRLSLSCNPDITLEMLDNARELDRPVLFAAQTHADLPFMENDAEISADAFDLLLHQPRLDRTLFAVPNAAVPATDYAAALHASSLVRDGGTLQIGIGSLGDAVAHACVVRHRDNSEYRALLAALGTDSRDIGGDPAPFDEGLYVSTEMFVNGMMHLLEHGVVKRRVYDSLPLQLALNRGDISEAVDERLYDWGRDSGFLPRRLDALALSRLQHWGLLPERLSLDGDELLLQGKRLPNDLDDAATRSALLAAGQGRQLRHGRVIHGGFFLGPRDFYHKLQQLDADAQSLVCMTGVRRTNQLLLDYPLYSAQRRHARFINTGMMASLHGAVASDALQDGTVISGVGGQYNFVAMAHDLPGARSILCIRATRGSGKRLQGNIVPHYGYTTIPRHLRDVIVTEYGVADLRGQSDAEVFKRMINVADSRFQEELLAYAKNHGKIEQQYRIPSACRNNTPARLAQVIGPAMRSGLLPDYPFGTELTEQEIALASSLRKIKALSEEPGQFLSRAVRALLHSGDESQARPFLERLRLDHPGTPREFIIQQMLMVELEERGLLKSRIG